MILDKVSAVLGLYMHFKGNLLDFSMHNFTIIKSLEAIMHSVNKYYFGSSLKE